MKKVDIQFRCPECDGSWFNTHYQVDDGKMVDSSMVGFCTSLDDYGNESCGFEWPRSEDWKYHVEVRSFETEAEYKAATGEE